MRIKIEFSAVLHAQGVESGDWVEFPGACSMMDVLNRLQIRSEHHRYVVPFINKEKASRSAPLKDGDQVFLSLPVGGG